MGAKNSKIEIRVIAPYGFEYAGKERQYNETYKATKKEADRLLRDGLISLTEGV